MSSARTSTISHFYAKRFRQVVSDGPAILVAANFASEMVTVNLKQGPAANALDATVALRSTGSDNEVTVVG